MAQEINNYAGMSVDSVTIKSAIEDFLKDEYSEGLRNEFSVMDALINQLSKDTITGKKKYKTFALGIVDNIRGLGNSNIKSDLYKIEAQDFLRGGPTVDAEFDTTKLIGVFSITDETILKGTSDGSIFDVMKDTLDRMNIGLKHTMNRFTYGAQDGKIGVNSSAVTVADNIEDSLDASPYQNIGYTPFTEPVFEVKLTNSHSLVSGMGLMLKAKENKNIVLKTLVDDVSTDVNLAALTGVIWQKNNSSIHDETVIIVVDKMFGTDGTAVTGTGKITIAAAGDVEVYSKQINGTNIANEYRGLEDIVVRQNNKIFGIDRNVYKSLNCPQYDLQGENFLTEDLLRDMADHIALTSPEATSINLVAANHRIISSIERQMYQFKQYLLDSNSNGFNLGGRDKITFDNFLLQKDKYARDNNVYMLDTTKIGELLRKDFDWITSGREGILERIDGTEVYEAIMTKYGDMYVDAWRCHAVIKNCKTLGVGQSYPVTPDPVTPDPVTPDPGDTGDEGEDDEGTDGEE